MKEILLKAELVDRSSEDATLAVHRLVTPVVVLKNMWRKEDDHRDDGYVPSLITETRLMETDKKSGEEGHNRRTLTADDVY